MKKRVIARRVDNDSEQQSVDSTDACGEQDISTSITSKLSGSKIWSFVSSILRFASLNSPNKNLSLQETKTNDNESNVIIRRCASFAGTLTSPFYI